jgi:pimeloyl-ACP methyl ester carboxylesterase
MPRSPRAGLVLLLALAAPLAHAEGPPATACPCRVAVHTYVINGCDPFGFADCRGVADRLRGLGYGPVHYYQTYGAGAVRRDITRLRHDDPCARVAVVGYSMGANGAAWVARRAAEDGSPVELLVFVDGVLLSGGAASRAGACRTISLSSDHILLEAPARMEGAENVRLPATNHFAVPTHPTVLAILACELEALGTVVGPPEAAAPVTR